MKQIVFSLVFVILLGCSRKEEFVALDLYELNKSKGSGIPTPHSDDIYYNEINFIIDSLGKFYYYNINFPTLHNCVSDQEIRASFLKLKPKDIKAISSKDFENWILRAKAENVINIVSVKDTFESPTLSKVFKKLRNEDKKWIWIIRKMTQEERVVFEYKQKGKLYNPNIVSWDTLKMKKITKIKKPQ